MSTGDGGVSAAVIAAIILAGAAAVGAIALGVFIRAARDRARTIIEPGDVMPGRCERCKGPLPPLRARWWLSTDGGVHCSQACADGGDRG